jgi:hypothetical protein
VRIARDDDIDYTKAQLLHLRAKAYQS